MKLADRVSRPTRRRLRVWVAAGAIAVAAGVAIALTGSGTDLPYNPHDAGAASDEQMERVLAAMEGSSATADADLVAQGRALFRSTDVAKQGEACNSCHPDGSENAELGLTPHERNPDQPVTENNFTGVREAPALWGAGRTAPYFWTGSQETLRGTVVSTLLNHFVEGASQPSSVTAAQANAIVAYLETLDPPVSAFDNGTMSQAALRGEEVFQGQGGCIGCHTGPLFTDGLVHDLCVPDLPGANDPGAAGPEGARLCGRPLRFFNTPILRDVKNTAPYMHNGRFATLEEVVEFYNSSSSIAPLQLSPQQISDLVAYLNSL